MNTRNLRIWTICFYLVRITAVFAHAPEAEITSLIKQLEHTDINVQNQARDALIEMGYPALPQLMENALGGAHLAHMHKPLEPNFASDAKTETAQVSTRIRHGCAEILIEMGKTAVPALIEVWRDDEVLYRRANAGRLLERMGKPALKAFIAELDAENSRVHQYALFALDDMMEYSQHPLAPETPYLTLAPRKDIIRGLTKALKDYGSQIHALAVSLLSDHGQNSPEAISALSEYLDYGSKFSPFAGLTLLTDMGEAGRKEVHKALSAYQWRRRFGAAYIYAEEANLRTLSQDFLDKIGPLPAPVVPILVEGLKHPGQGVQVLAKDSLYKLKRYGFENARKAYDKHVPPELRLSNFLRLIRHLKVEQIIYGEVVDVRFVPREGIGYPITTDVMLQILHQIKGHPNPNQNQNRVTFMTPGGILPDGSVVEVTDVPGFQTGEKVIVFLTTDEHQYPHDGLTIVANAKLAVVNDRVEIPVRRLTLPIKFVVKFAKAALIGTEAVFPIDKELNRRAKAATELARYGAQYNTLLNPSPKDLALLEAQLDAILKGQNPNETKVKKVGANRNR